MAVLIKVWAFTMDHQSQNQDHLPPGWQDKPWELVREVPLTIDHSRTADLYAAAGCQGYLLVHRIERNAEDAALLLNWPVKVSFYWDGRYHDSFPSIGFFLERTLAKFRFANAPAPEVLAIGENGRCGLLTGLKQAAAKRNSPSF
ncbi:hypothetical protein [Aestuariispira insulae]|nr:hypothetical protein [Aestuariispira insulae]